MPSMSFNSLRRLDSQARGVLTWTNPLAQPRSRTAASRSAHGIGISSGSSGGGTWQGQRSVDALKAQMTDEEMAVDQASCVWNVNYK